MVFCSVELPPNGLHGLIHVRHSLAVLVSEVCYYLPFVPALGANAQTLGFSGPTSSQQMNVGGNSQREGVSGTVFADDHRLYVAYTSRQGNARGDAPVYVSSSGDGTGSDIFAGFQATFDPGSNLTISSNANPAITAINHQLVMALNDSYGNVSLVKSSGYNAGQQNPITWGTQFVGALSGTDGSPALAVHYINSIPYLFVAARNAADHSLWLAQFDGS
jgi:hypothetical protein